MIHVDVAKRDDYTVAVQTSVDGSKWTDQFIHNRQVDEAEDKAREDAEWTARVFVAGLRFAGAEVRATSHGYAL